jgi:hypothetical protein
MGTMLYLFEFLKGNRIPTVDVCGGGELISGTGSGGWAFRSADHRRDIRTAPRETPATLMAGANRFGSYW